MRQLPCWPSEECAGKPLHPAVFHEPKTCRRCGKAFLFWREINGRWRLHHYAMLPGDEKPGYVLHRCGFDSAGNAIATEARRAETPQDGSVHEGAGLKGIAQDQSHDQ